MRKVGGRFAAVLVLVVWCTPIHTAAQAQPENPLTAARRLRDAGEFGAAVQLLRIQLGQHPDDGEAARLLAQTLYWMKDVNGARVVYEAALVRHPGDTTLRLQYARMLAETGQRSRARVLLAGLAESSATRSEADTLLGTLAYWDGDLTTAKRLFTEALQANPAQTDAQRQLRAIQSMSAPWIRMFAGLRHDNQPLDRLGGGIEAGWFATPVLPISVRLEPMQYQLPNSTTRRLWSAELTIADFFPAARLETEVAVGMLRRSEGVGDTDWHGHAVVGVRLTPDVTFRGRIERAPYLYTTSSLDTPVMTRAATASVHWNSARGWLGEAAYAQRQFPDANVIATTYAWLLAPLVHRERGTQIQVGYAFETGNADQGRFVLANATQAYEPDDPRFDTSGRYVPYYTPAHLVTHSAIAAVAFRPSSAIALRLSGAYPIRADDVAPVFVVSGTQVQSTTYDRSFSPWSARTSLEMAIRDGLTITATGELGRTAFYSWAAAEVQVTYRFTRGAMSQVRVP